MSKIETDYNKKSTESLLNVWLQESSADKDIETSLFDYISSQGKMLVSKQTPYSQLDYQPGIGSDPVTPSKYNSFIEVMKRLEYVINNINTKVEDNSKQLLELNERIENVSIKTGLQESKSEELYIYFQTRAEGIKVLKYCQRNNIQISPVAPGTLKISASYIDKLASQGFEFKTTKNISAIYKDKEFIESHKKQIEDHYEI